MTAALHSVTVPADVVVAIQFLQAGTDALERAIGGDRRRIAAAAMHLMHTDAIVGFLEHEFHVIDINTDIFGGDVAAIERFHEAAQSAKQRFRFIFAWIADDHRFAAAQVQTGHSGLVGHASRQAQHIIECILFGFIRPHAQTAQGRAQRSVVDGDDGLEAGVFVVAEHHLLMFGLIDLSKQVHTITLQLMMASPQA